MTDVSVVMPCYCNGATVERAVASVFGQSAPPLELIAVDDASRDDTVRRLHVLREQFGKERLLIVESRTNEGPSAARNAGWQAARGEYVALLDADDAWHPRKLEIQRGFMRAHPEFPFTAHLLSFGDAAQASMPDGASAPFTEIRFRSMLYRNWFHTSSVMMRRDLPQRFDANKRYGEDRQLWLDVAAAGNRIARLDLPLLSVYKPMYGASGLSADLWAMEAAELETFYALYRAGHINAPLAAIVLGWSLARYVRRVVQVRLRRAWDARSA